MSALVRAWAWKPTSVQLRILLIAYCRVLVSGSSPTIVPSAGTCCPHSLPESPASNLSEASGPEPSCCTQTCTAFGRPKSVWFPGRSCGLVAGVVASIISCCPGAMRLDADVSEKSAVRRLFRVRLFCIRLCTSSLSSPDGALSLLVVRLISARRLCTRSSNAASRFSSSSSSVLSWLRERGTCGSSFQTRASRTSEL